MLACHYLLLLINAVLFAQRKALEPAIYTKPNTWPVRFGSVRFTFTFTFALVANH